MREEQQLSGAAAGRPRLSILTLLLTLSLIGCGGGGGGSGAGAKAERRSTQTGLRIIHASIDETPLEVVVSESVVQTAGFAETTYYVPVKRGEQIVTIQRRNLPGIALSNVPIAFESKTEYTLFLTGEARRGSTSITTYDDAIERPAQGFARVQLYHGYDGAGALTLRAKSAAGEAVNIGTAEDGSRSEHVELEAGAYTFTIVNGRGVQVGSISAELEDRSETAILIAGSSRLDVSFIRLFVDFD